MRSNRWGQALVTSCVLSLALAATGSASAPPITVEWSVPAACGSAEQLESSFAHAFADRSSSDAYVGGRIRHTSRGYRLDLTVDVAGQRSMRTLTAKDCDSLVEAARWLIGLALGESSEGPAPEQAVSDRPALDAEPAALDPPAESPIETSSAPRTTTAPAVDASEAPAMPHDDRVHAPRVRLGLVTGGSAAGLSGIDWSAGARVGLQLDPLMFELSGLYHVPRPIALEMIPGADVTFETLELDGSGCWRFGAQLHGGPCVFVAALHTRGATHGISSRREDASWWAASGVSALVGFAVSERFDVRLDGGAWLALTARPTFRVALDRGASLDVGEVDLAGGFVRVGIDWILP